MIEQRRAWARLRGGIGEFVRPAWCESKENRRQLDRFCTVPYAQYAPVLQFPHDGCGVVPTEGVLYTFLGYNAAMLKPHAAGVEAAVGFGNLAQN
jgi:hypothetical protein